MTRRLLLVLVAALAVGALARPMTLRLAFEDRNDPNPRQMQIGAEMLGVGLGLVLSWTQHALITR